MEEHQKETIEKVVTEFFNKTTLVKSLDIKIFPTVNPLNNNTETFDLDITTEDPHILIGHQGQTLAEIQKILRMILNKKMEKNFYVNLDINGYKRKKTEYLKYLAEESANQVSSTKTEKILQPMSAYERRILHAELANREDVLAESRGQEPERYIVVMPKN